jgi:hypothetical protein
LVGEIAAAMDVVTECLRGRGQVKFELAVAVLGTYGNKLGQFVEGGLKKAAVVEVVDAANKEIRADGSSADARLGGAPCEVKVDWGLMYKDGGRFYIKVVDGVVGEDIWSRYRAMAYKLGVMGRLQEKLGCLGKENGLKVGFKGKDLATRHGQGDDRMARLTYFP